MSKTSQVISPTVTNEQADHEALTNIFYDQKEKLEEKRKEGYGGWHRPQECSVEHLSFLLITHLKKGDPVDVANFAMMLHGRDGGGEAMSKTAKRMFYAGDEDQ